jgi:hypothetical protein
LKPPVEEHAVISLEDGDAGLEKFGTWYHNDIKPHRNLVAAENLSYQALSTVTLDCATQFFRGGDSKTPDLMLVGEHEQGAVATLNPRASLVYPLKFDASSNALVRSEPARHGHSPPARTSAGPCDRFLLAADSQAFTPFRTPPLQHKAAVFGTHSYEKPMSFLAAASIGLKCPLSLHCESFCSNIKPSMVANAFLRCQLVRLCVTVGGFRESSPRRSRACAFGCSPKFSTPVEKTVEIRQVWN